MNYKKAFYLYFCFSIIASVFFLFKKKESLSDSNLRIVANKNSWSNIVREITKVKNGDSKAAYDLGVYYQFVEKDFTAAYFWMVKAQKMSYKDARQDVVDAIERSVFSVVPTDVERNNKDGNDEGAEAAELPYKGKMGTHDNQ